MSDLNDVIDNDSNGSISTSMKKTLKKLHLGCNSLEFYL